MTIHTNKRGWRVFLIVDATGRYAHVRIQGSPDACIQQLEDAGCEVVEDQTVDYDGLPEEWDDTITLEQLITSTDFISHP
jgi:hypothetical protein